MIPRSIFETEIMLLTLSIAYCLAAPPAAPVTAAAYSPDGKALVAGTRGEVFVLDTSTGEALVKVKGLTGRVTAVSWAGNRRYAVSSGEPGQSGVISIFDVNNSKPISQWIAHNDSIFALAITKDGKQILSAGYDRVIKLWPVDGDHSKPTAVLKDHSDAIYGLSIHPSGKLLASVSADRAVKIWDIASAKRLYTLGDNTDWVYSVAWSPDGTHLAAAGVDKSLRVWKADDKSGTLERSAFAHSGAIVKLAYSADGQSIVTAGEDRIVKVWNANELKEKVIFSAQPEAILSLAIHPNEKQIAVGRFDGTLSILDSTTGKVLQTPVPVKPTPPKITSISPAFLPRGVMTRVTITGTGLESTTKLNLNGVKAEFPFKPTETHLVADMTVSPTAVVGPNSLTLHSDHGTSVPFPITIERFLAINKSDRKVAGSAALMIPLNSTIVGNLERAGDVDEYQFEALAGQEIGLVVNTKLSPIVSLIDPSGKTIAESTTGVLGIVIPAAGKYRLAIRDRDFRGGNDSSYRISFGKVPVVTSIFPPAVSKGSSTTIHITGVNLKENEAGLSIPVTIPEKEVLQKLDLLPLLNLNERPEGAATVAIESVTSVVANGMTGRLPAIPFACDGVLATPGSSLVVKFTAKKGETLIVEGLARRYGSPVDPQIEIQDVSGKIVPRATLRCIAKTYLTFRDHDSAKPGLRLETWNELKANDLLLIDQELVKIRQLPGHPDADCDFFEVNGKRTSFLDTNNAHHAVNSPMYRVEAHPANTQLPTNGMPVFHLDYRNDDGGPGYGKDARLFFTAPADGEYRVKLTDARGYGGANDVARVVVRYPQPDIRISFSPNAPQVWKGGTIPIAVNVERIDGFEGPIQLSFADLPKGFSSIPGRVDAGFHTTTLSLSSTLDAVADSRPLKLMARLTVNGKEQVREFVGKSVMAVEPGDIITKVNSPSLTLKPGMETKFIVTVERRNGFTGRIPIDVRGLPHGVMVQNIGLNAIMITEKETQREIVLRAESWIDPISVPIIVVARREGKGTEHAAAPIILEVKK